MKYSIIQNRIGTLLIFVFAMGMTSLAEAQNATQVIQTDKQESPSIKVQIVESPNGGRQTAKNNNVLVITMEKSDKMEIVSVKGVDTKSKTVPTEKTITVQKMKSEKIDH